MKPNGEDEKREKDSEPDLIEKTAGSFGWYQFFVYLLLEFGSLPSDFQFTSVSFLIPAVSYVCADDGGNSTNTCPCSNPIYDRSIFQETVVTKWDLICDKKWMSTITQSILHVGIFVGSFSYGIIADRFGRKTAIVTAMCAELVCIAASGLTPGFWSFVFLRFLCGTSMGGVMLTSFTLQVELSGKSFRPYIAVMERFSYAVACVSLSGIAYAVRDFQYLQLYTSVPFVVCVSYYWILPESPRWLITKGRKQEAIETLEKMAKRNGRSSDHINEYITQFEKEASLQSQESGRFLDLVRTSTIRRYAILSCSAWMACSFIASGTAQYIGRLDGNIYLNTLIASCMVIPGYFILLLLLLRTKRRTSGPCLFFTAGILIIITLFIGSDMGFLRLFLLSVSHVGLFIGFMFVYLYTSEIFPTILRNSAMGMSSMAARIGGFVAPFVVDIGVEWIALLSFGVVSVLCSFLFYFMPETKGENLVNTVDELTKFKTLKKSNKVSAIGENGSTIPHRVPT